MKKTLRYAGLAIVSLFFFVGGSAHFTATELFTSIVPPYVPYPRAVVYITGFMELLGAAVLWVPTWRRWAGNGLIALTICVTPANVHMWLNPQLFPNISEAALTWRLIAQVALLACIWWSTRPTFDAPVRMHQGRMVAAREIERDD